MSDTPTKEDVLKAIVPDSTQINADDLVGAPITVTIERVSKGSKEQPINIHLVGYDRVFRPCKTMLRILRHEDVFTVEPENWVGKQMTLYCDPDVTMGGVKVGGVRISHLSGLDSAHTFIVTKSRGKRGGVTIQPIKTLSPEDQKFIAEAGPEISAASSLEALGAYGEVLKTKSACVQDALRPLYAKRLDYLKCQEALK